MDLSRWRLRKQAALAGGQVAWDRFGEGSPVVLVHGTPSCSYLWRKVVPPLAERFSVYEEVVKAHLRTAVHRSLEDDALAAYLAPWRGEEGQAAYFRKIAQWTDADVGELEPLLPEIRVPVRILWGEEDRWLDRSVAERVAARIPRAELRLVPGAGHFRAGGRAEAVAQELAESFAAEPEPPSGSYAGGSRRTS